tara:strand:+ start:966 stop:1259 length:294 start_codon:yes stop_codon:yes gene_type:complete
MSKATKEINKIKVGGVEYELLYFDERGRREVMDRLLLDQMQSVNGKSYVSLTAMFLTVTNGTVLTKEEVNDLPNDDLVKLSDAVMTFNEKKRTKKQS